MKKENSNMKTKMLKPFNVMTTSFLLASTLLTTNVGFAEEVSTPKDAVQALNVEEETIGQSPEIGEELSKTPEGGKESQTLEVEEELPQTPGVEEELPKTPEAQEVETIENEAAKPANIVVPNAAGEAIVNNFNELKTVIESDNGITKIILGQNISLTKGIKIHNNKRELTIEGNNYTITEAAGKTLADAIYVDGGTSKSIVVKNLNVKGKNYYGFIAATDTAKDVVVTYENLTYSGPQLMFNRYGKIIFSGTTNIDINDTTVADSSPAQEVAEVKEVEFYGDFHLKQGSAYASFWSYTGDETSKFEIAPNANVQIQTLDHSHPIYYQHANKGNIIIGENATVNINGAKSLAYNALTSFEVKSGATVKLEKTSTQTYAMINVSGVLSVERDATLNVNILKGNALELSNAQANFDNTASVILSGVKAINNSGYSYININAGSVKVWDNNDTVPTHNFVSKDGNDFTWTGSYKHNVALSLKGSRNINPFNLELSVVKKIEIGKNEDSQLKKDLADAKNKAEGLYTDGNFNKLKDTTNQTAINDAQKAVEKLPAGPEKERLQGLVDKAQDLLNQQGQTEKDVADAKNKAEGLFTDGNFNKLKDTANQAAIDEAQKAVSKLPAGPEKERLQGLVDKAQDLLNQQGQAEKDVADAKNKAEGLFTDGNFNKLKDTANQAAIDEAQKAVSKLPAGPEKERLQGLVDKAQDLLNQQGQAEKDVADAKNKVEGLFKGNKFNALKDKTNQAAIDDAQKAVNKLPAGPEKERLQGLVDKAQDLLNQQGQTEKDVADAKNKAEGLFTDGNFNKLKDTANQTAINDAQKAVEKLPAGPEKERLQGLVDKAQDLLNQQGQAEKDVADAKNKAEGLFTDGNFNKLKDTANQTAINDAQKAVEKLPAGPEKERLQGLVDKAQDLLNQQGQTEKDVADAKNKAEGLFTDGNFNKLKDTANQTAINDAQKAVEKLPAGPEKERLQGLVDKAQDLLNQQGQTEKDVADAKNKAEGLFTDGNFNKLKDTTNQTVIDEAQNAINKLPAGPEKDRLQKLVDNAKDLFDASQLSLTADPLSVGQNTMYGKNSPGTVKVNIYLNDEFVRVRNVNGDGTFSGHVSNTLKAGDVVRLVPIDAKGRQGTAIEVIVGANVGAPTLNTYIEGDMYLTGTVAKDTSYVRVYVNGVHLRKRNVEANGVDLLVYVSDSGAKVGDIIKVVPYNSKDVAGQEAAIVVQAPPVEIKEYLEGDEQIFGQTVTAADKIDIYVNGKFLRTRVVDKVTGEFFGSMRSTIDGLPKAGDIIKLVARTDKGSVLSQMEITVGEKVGQGAPTAQQFTEGQTTITGTVPQGAQKIRVYYGTDFKQILNRGVVDIEKQTYSVYVGDLGLKAGNQVKIVSVNELGRESAPFILTVK
ncbi:toxin Cry1Ac domain D-VI-related protein [Lysinibacillus fusiformis]|uniref:toxin Cry1Ac domain D-VI-related protein n=1 Tax=Lysinibacillus fusiformis TaxID=28031 RepID=UPI003803CCED